MPTTEQELEQYGVWVKAEPQDIIEEPETDHAVLGKGSAPLATREPPESENDSIILTEAEESVLDSFDGLPELDEFGTDETISANEDSSEQAADDNFTIDFSEDTLEIPSSGLEDTEALEPVPDESPSSEVIDISLSDDAFELEDAPQEAAKTDKAPAHASADEMTELSLDDFGLDDDGPAESKAAPQAPKGNLESVDLSDFGLEEESPEKDTQNETASDEFEPIEIDLQFDDTIPSPADQSTDVMEDFDLDAVEDMNAATPSSASDEVLPEIESPEEIDDVEIVEAEDVTLAFSSPEKPLNIPLGKQGGVSNIKSGLDSFIDADDSMDSGIPVIETGGAQIARSTPKAGQFDDVAALRDDLSDSVGSKEKSVPISMLEQISEELSSIKQELMSLRSQLKEIKPEARREEAEPSSSEEPSSDGASGGFFDDEDDETIALTGDELDNILNTADFTEETVEGSSLDETALDEFPTQDILQEEPAEPAGFQESDRAEEPLVQENLLPEDGDYSSSVQGIETINLAEEPEAAAEAGLGDAEDPTSLYSEINPLTEAPEDTSYLDSGAQDTALSEELDVAPLDDVPLVEPDLSEIDVSDVLVDSHDAPSEELLDIETFEPDTIEDPSSTDLMEEIILEEDTTTEEITLSIETEESALDSSAEIGFDSIPEIDELGDLEDEAGSIDLHTEDSTIEQQIVANTTKPAEPVGIHPDELSMSLDDSLFVQPEAASPAEDDFSLPEEDSPELTIPSAPQEAQEPVAQEPSLPVEAPQAEPGSDKLKKDVKSVLLYLDQLLAALPEEKIEEFASSEYYETYKSLFEELGLI